MSLTRNENARGLRRWQLAVALASVAILMGLAGCEPEIGNDPVPEFMEFDTGTGRIPEPTIAAVSQTTGLLDFAPLGIVVPEGIGACETDPTWSTMVAECEFFQYLQTLDGYPTLSSMRAPASAALDPATLTFSGGADDNLVVLEGGMSKLTDADGLVVAVNPDDDYVYIDNPAGWEIGTLYVTAIRGYDNGVVTADGTRVVASTIYSLLKREESLLDCEPDAEDPPFYNASASVDEHCYYYELVHEMYVSSIPDPDVLHATVVGLLGSLESLRQGLKGTDGFTGAWDLMGSVGQMPKDEVAVVWAWPTHTQSVVEVFPGTKEPIAEGSDTLRLGFKGTIDASSLVPFNLGNGFEATTYLMNATILDQVINQGIGSITDAVPDFTATIEDDEIVLTAAAPLADGDRYVIMLVSKLPGDGRDADFGVLDGPAGETTTRTLVASPLTVFLRSRGPLADADGNSLVSKMDDATAAFAEEGRAALQQLLDEPLFESLTGNCTPDPCPIIRENIVYLYAFDYVAP